LPSVLDDPKISIVNCALAVNPFESVIVYVKYSNNFSPGFNVSFKPEFAV